MKITNTKVYGLKDMLIVSGFPMLDKSMDSLLFDIQTNYNENTLNKNDKNYKRCLKLALAKPASGHDSFLKGVTVQYNLTCSSVFLIQKMRYHFWDITSSMSTMHRISKFDLDNIHTKYVDSIMLDRFKVLVKNYNNNPCDETFNIMMDSSMKGLELTMGCINNYLQLKSMYNQRKNHKYYQWHIFCEFIESLPYSEFITGKVCK